MVGGRDAAQGRPDTDRRWPDYAFAIGRDWRSGVYGAELATPDDTPHETPDLAATSGAVLFVVRGDVSANIVSANTVPPLVGYEECDGAPLEFDTTTRVATLAHDAARCATPEDFEVPAATPLSREWDELPARAATAPARACTPRWASMRPVALF